MRDLILVWALILANIFECLLVNLIDCSYIHLNMINLIIIKFLKVDSIFSNSSKRSLFKLSTRT